MLSVSLAGSSPWLPSPPQVSNKPETCFVSPPLLVPDPEPQTRMSVSQHLRVFSEFTVTYTLNPLSFHLSEPIGWGSGCQGSQWSQWSWGDSEGTNSNLTTFVSLQHESCFIKHFYLSQDSWLPLSMALSLSGHIFQTGIHSLIITWLCLSYSPSQTSLLGSS